MVNQGQLVANKNEGEFIFFYLFEEMLIRTGQSHVHFPLFS